MNNDVFHLPLNTRHLSWSLDPGLPYLSEKTLIYSTAFCNQVSRKKIRETHIIAGINKDAWKYYITTKQIIHQKVVSLSHPLVILISLSVPAGLLLSSAVIWHVDLLICTMPAWRMAGDRHRMRGIGPCHNQRERVGL